MGMSKKEYDKQDVLQGLIKDFYRTGDRSIVPKISETYRGLLNQKDYTIPAGINDQLKECMNRYSFAKEEFEGVLHENRMNSKRKSRIHLIKSAKMGREDTRNALKFNHEAYVNSSNKSPGYTLGRARELMDYSVKRGDLQGALNAHRLYDQIGKGNSPNAVEGVMKTYALAKQKGLINAGLEQMVEEVRRDHQKIRNEERVKAAVAFAGLIGGAFLLSSNMTGNAIVEDSIQTTSMVGVLLFVIAIISAFLWLNCKKNSQKKVVVKSKKKK